MRNNYVSPSQMGGLLCLSFTDGGLFILSFTDGGLRDIIVPPSVKERHNCSSSVK
jgi:hypothetical protein